MPGRKKSNPQRRKPAHISPPARGTRATLAKGPTTEARPKVAANSGQRTAEIAALTPAKIRTPRATEGQVRGRRASRRGVTASKVAQAPTLMSAPGESAAAGLLRSKAAAAAVSAAEVEPGRSRARAESPAASINQARRQGGSAPAMIT